MPRDYKHRAAKKPSKKPLPGWLWLLTGLLLGGFIVGLVWLQGQSGQTGGEWVGAQPDRPPQGAKPARRVDVPPAPKRRYDFYDDLATQEVPLPDVPVEELRPPPQKKQAPVAGTYVIQAGSFRRNADADRVRAQLALLGVQARVVPARIGPDDTRYRVQSGPYKDRAGVERTRRRLAENGFRPIVIPQQR